MQIRYFSYFYPPCIGGGEVILQHQAEGLAGRGHDVHVHTTPFTNLNLAEQVRPGTQVERGVVVHRRRSVAIPFRTPMEKPVWTPAFSADVRLTADLRVAVGFPSLHLGPVLAAGRRTGTPVIAQNYLTAAFLDEILAGEGGPHKRLRAALWRGPVRRQLAACDLVIADSPLAGKALEERLGLDNVRVHIGMAVDPAELAAVGPAEGAAVRARLGLGADRVLLAPSRVSRQKGADLLLDAVGPVLPAGWRVVIAGPVNEAEFVEEVDRRIASLGGRALRTLLPRAELVALMHEADVVCLPSRGETVGGVVFEGMYAGALVVVSDAVEAAALDYLRDGVNGLLFPAGDVGALRAALLRAMTTESSEMRRAGREMVEQRFVWSRSVDRLWGLYEEAAARAARRAR